MWVSEVKTKKGRALGSFHHRKSFATMDEGLDWARNLAMQIVENDFKGEYAAIEKIDPDKLI